MIRLLLLLCAEVAAVAATGHASLPHRRPASGWAAALSASGPGDALVALVHLGAWAAAWWLLLGTSHDLVAALIHHRRGSRPRHRGRLVPPWVRRVVDQAIGTALALAVMAGPAVAATEVPAAAPAVVAVVRPPVGPVPLTPSENSTADPASTPPAAPPMPEGDGGHSPMPPEQVDAATPPAAADEPHVVAAGENLWVIARARLVQDGRTPTDREVHAYWIRLIQDNALPSGDPDLIHPGEVLTLPPLAPGTTG